MRIRGAGEDVEIVVTDAGPRIDPEDMSKLFVPFGRVGDTSLARGTGLGLYASKGIVGRTVAPSPARAPAPVGAGPTVCVCPPRGQPLNLLGEIKTS